MLNLAEPSKRIDHPNGDPMWTIAWCRDRIVTGSIGGNVQLYSPIENQWLIGFERSKIGITSIVTSQDGLTAVACYQDSTVKFFDLLQEQEKECLDLKVGDAYSLSLSPGEDILVSGSSTGNINVWSMLDNHEKVTTIPAGGKFIFSTSFSVDGRLASGATDGAVYVHDLSTQQQTHKFDAHAMPVRCVAFTSDGTMLLSAGDDRQVHLYDVRSGQTVFSFSHKSPAFSVDASPNRRHIIVGCQDGGISLWDLGSMSELKKYDCHKDAVWCVAYDKNDVNGNRFASAGDDGAMHLFV